MDTSREHADADIGPVAGPAVGPVAGSVGFAVSPGDLQRAAQQAATCAADLRSVTARWSGAVAGAGMAMPEPSSTTLLGEVDAALQRVLTARGRQMDELAAGLRAAATSYIDADTSAGDAAGRIGREPGEHPTEQPADRGGAPGSRSPR